METLINKLSKSVTAANWNGSDLPTPVNGVICEDFVIDNEVSQCEFDKYIHKYGCQIKKITGDFIVKRNCKDIHIHGFTALESIDRTAASGMKGLGPSEPSQVMVYESAKSCITFDCFPSLKVIGGILVSNVDRCQISFPGFDAVQHIFGSINVENFSKSEICFSKFASLESVMEINVGSPARSTDSRIHFDGFPKLKSVCNIHVVSLTNDLVTFNGFNCLENLNNITIGQCDSPFLNNTNSTVAFNGFGNIQIMGNLSVACNINSQICLNGFSGICVMGQPDKQEFLSLGQINISNNSENTHVSLKGFNDIQGSTMLLQQLIYLTIAIPIFHCMDSIIVILQV
jgi:hypothetical protein